MNPVRYRGSFHTTSSSIVSISGFRTRGHRDPWSIRHVSVKAAWPLLKLSPFPRPRPECLHPHRDLSHSDLCPCSASSSHRCRLSCRRAFIPAVFISVPFSASCPASTILSVPASIHGAIPIFIRGPSHALPPIEHLYEAIQRPLHLDSRQPLDIRRPNHRNVHTTSPKVRRPRRRGDMEGAMLELKPCRV